MRCDNLDPFFDGELASDEAGAFRDHLTGCARCQKVLRGRMLEAAVVTPVALEPAAVGAGAAPAAVPDPAATSQEPALDRPPPWRRAIVAVAATGAAMTAGLVGLWPSPRGPVGATLALAVQRGVEVRFSAAALDHYRPYDVMRATPAAQHERIKLADLADLERRGELHALVGASALNGDLVTAERSAGELPRTAASLTDRAAIELLRGSPVPPESLGGAARDTAAERALSLTSEALRVDPGYAQARWNQAIAARRLGLSLVAARAFDGIAALGEAGWSDEAAAAARSLRAADRRADDDWARVTAAANRMVRGGPVLADIDVARAPSLARDAFYLALATAATPARLDALAPVARILDAEFATTALGALINQVRASDLRARAPLCAALAAVIEHPRPRAAVDELRSRAIRSGAADIALASFLAVGDGLTSDADVALLDRLAGDRDPWWRLVGLARRAWLAEFRHRDYPAVDAAARLAAPICKTVRAAWCGQITRFAGGANSEMGRADLAIEQITSALRQARGAAARDDEVDALEALGQAIANRLADDIDSSAVAGGYLQEVALRQPTCDRRLQRLDFAADAALQYHRFDDAAGLRAEADGLELGECRDAALRLNGETARLRLLLRGRASLATLRDKLAILVAEDLPNRSLYLDFLAAAAELADDPPRGELAVRRVLAAAIANPHRSFASLVRAGAFDVLAEAVARSGGAEAVLALLSERLGAPRFARCVVGVASWNRLIVAALDADGRPALETREIPEGVLMFPAPQVVSPSLRARLARCARVEVVTPGPYFGAAGLLGDDVAWVYHSGTPRPPRPLEAVRELVVSNVTPPEDLHLPALQPLSGAAGAVVLNGPRATPANVLAAIQSAGLVVIVAHGLTDANEPTAASLILSPDRQGDYLLTASKVSAARLAGAPIIVLAGCDAGRVQVAAEPWSLATSFIAAGARVVIAPTEPIPDAGANEVFRSLVDRLRAGVDPADALVAERRARGPTPPWMSSIVVFE